MLQFLITGVWYEDETKWMPILLRQDNLVDVRLILGKAPQYPRAPAPELPKCYLYTRINYGKGHHGKWLCRNKLALKHVNSGEINMMFDLFLILYHISLPFPQLKREWDESRSTPVLLDPVLGKVIWFQAEILCIPWKDVFGFRSGADGRPDNDVDLRSDVLCSLIDKSRTLSLWPFTGVGSTVSEQSSIGSPVLESSELRYLHVYYAYRKSCSQWVVARLTLCHSDADLMAKLEAVMEEKLSDDA
ncbi:unnamed protein product [Notodromas monacha]|uniref:Uncharacterized protein n=1 Tax=Notodromas monacha TaxID=399045 RepID=A0A7R9GC82_9CRUS|nr:unnamed protein product [Notodromas monacha]CAG0915839.1 unnamed protein product [Notodromas monacha]